MSSQYADEGTIAHALAAMCLTEARPASAYIGRVIESEDYEHASLSPSGAARWMRCPGSHALETRIKFVPRKFSLPVTDEMAEGVQTYLDNIAKYVSGIGHANFEVSVEKELPIGQLTGEEGATGTGDFILLDFDAAEIQVHDLKFGQGVEVYAKDNEQLRIYLLGALHQYGTLAPEGGWKRFRGVIHQPRLHSAPDEESWTREELEAFGEEVKAAARRATEAREECDTDCETWEGENLEPGDKQCQFCEAKPNCPAIQRQVAEIALGAFVDLDAAPADRTRLAAIPADHAKLASLKAWTPLIRSWCDAIDAHVESEILNGAKVPGFKVVAGRRGNRAWADDGLVEKLFKSFRMRQDEMYSMKLISPAVAEKALKAEPKRWAKALEYITQAEGKPTVVPEDDKRTALVITPVADQFENLERELV